MSSLLLGSLNPAADLTLFNVYADHWFLLASATHYIWVSLLEVASSAIFLSTDTNRPSHLLSKWILWLLKPAVPFRAINMWLSPYHTLHSINHVAIFLPTTPLGKRSTYWDTSLLYWRSPFPQSFTQSTSSTVFSSTCSNH